MPKLSLDTEVQRRFVENITGDTPNLSRALKVYGMLVGYRFEEVIDNAFARLKPFYSEAAWQTLVQHFIARGGRAPYIWQVPDEFRRMVKKEEKRPWVNELFWYEWIEIALHKARAKRSKKRALSFDKTARLSPTVRIKHLHYPVHRRDDDSALEEAKGDFYLMLYRNPEDDEIMVTELTPFMYRVLKRLSNHPTLGDSVDEAARHFGEKPKEVREVIFPALAEMFKLHLLI